MSKVESLFGLPYVHRQDDGCDEGGPSCLDCQLPFCKYEKPITQASIKREAIKQRIDQGASVEVIAVEFSVSKRTVYRAKK